MSSNEIINVIEYKDEGLAILEDEKGKFLFTRDNPDPIPLPDENLVKAWMGSRNPCALLQSRAAMLT